jgi:hypothetical protein
MNQVNESPLPPGELQAAVIGEVEPNVVLGALAGLVAALIGAVLWAVVTVATKMQIGFMALGVGLLVAWAVRSFGKGSSQIFSILGAGFALAGCVLGNLLSACAFVAADQNAPLMNVVTQVLADPSQAVQLLQKSFNGRDLLFYALAAYEGYKFGRLARPRQATPAAGTGAGG